MNRTMDWIKVILLILITLILELIKNLSNFNNLDFLSTVPIDILRILGIFLSVYGVILIGIEKKLDLPFFYAANKHYSLFCNGIFICSLGIAMMSHYFLQTIIFMCVFCAIIIIELFFIESNKKQRRA